jgi:hypothetical protein
VFICRDDPHCLGHRFGLVQSAEAFVIVAQVSRWDNCRWLWKSSRHY